MTGTVTRKGSISALALPALLAAIGLASAAIPPMAASAPPSASETAAGYRPSEWAEASDFASADKAPSLTNDAMAPEGETGSQLSLGFGLVGLALLCLVGGLAATITKRGSARVRPLAYSGASRTSASALPKPSRRAAGQPE